jgi:hypothetical protein
VGISDFRMAEIYRDKWFAIARTVEPRDPSPAGCEITRVGLLVRTRCGESTRVSQGGQFHMFGAVGKNTTEDFVQSRTSSNTFSNHSEGA